MSSEENSSSKGDTFNVTEDDILYNGQCLDESSTDKNSSIQEVSTYLQTDEYISINDDFREIMNVNNPITWSICEIPKDCILDIHTLLSLLSAHPLKGVNVNLLDINTYEEIDNILANCGITISSSKHILHYAIIEKNYTFLALLLKSSFRDLINERDALGRTPFQIALINADVVAVQLFLSRPLNISSVTNIPIPLLDISFPDLSLDFAEIPTIHLPLSAAYQSSLILSVEKIYRLLIGYISLINQIKLNEPIRLIEPFGEACGWSCLESENQSIITVEQCYKLLSAFVESHGEETDWSIDSIDFPNGMSVFHRANSMGLLTIVQILLEGGSNPLLKDSHGNLPVHHAIKSGSPETFAFLLQSSNLETSGCSPLKEETSIMTLFRCCILRGAWKCLGHLISDEVYSQYPISESDFDLLAEYATFCGFRREFAEAFNMAIDNSISLENGCLKNEEIPPVKLFTNEECQSHLSVTEDTDFLLSKQKRSIYTTYPENFSRLQCLIDPKIGILRSSQFIGIPWKFNSTPVNMADILRVHEWGYIKRLLSKVEHLNNNDQNDYNLIGDLDVDTPVTAGSWLAACAASGTVLDAIRAVCKGECRTAFCAIRPPGHHVGTWGACQQPNNNNDCWDTTGEEDWVHGSQGFCILNNVAIGAAYARYNFSEFGIRRIAIVDFDIHHGNGTEQITRNLVARKKKSTLTSTRQSDFTFSATYTQDFWKPWLDFSDSEEIFFASIHGFGMNFYPGTGGSDITSDYPHCHNIPIANKTTARTVFREAFIEKLINPLFEFKPDLLLISAGFDGHCLDLVNAGYGGCCEDDFEWITRLLVSVANVCCNGRLVSVLEGGYNTKAGPLSPFAQSVARHVLVLEQSSSELYLEAVKQLNKLNDSLPSNLNIKRPAESDNENNIREPPKRRKRAAAVKALAVIEKKMQNIKNQ